MSGGNGRGEMDGGGEGRGEKTEGEIRRVRKVKDWERRGSGSLQDSRRGVGFAERAAVFRRETRGESWVGVVGGGILAEQSHLGG